MREDLKFLVVGDTIIDEKNLALLAIEENQMAMMVTTVDDGEKFGVVKSNNGILETIIEKGVSGKSSINAGIYLFNHNIFKSLKTILHKSGFKKVSILVCLLKIDKNQITLS